MNNYCTMCTKKLKILLTERKVENSKVCDEANDGTEEALSGGRTQNILLSRT